MESIPALFVVKLSRALRASQAFVTWTTVSQANVEVTLRHRKTTLFNPHVTVGKPSAIAELETKEHP